jgi:predicted Zn-ribbon and HTH transcriptional regulator
MGDTIAGTLALAARLEGEGQYNIAKLLRAGAASAINRAAFKLVLPADKAQLSGEIMRAIGALSILEADKSLLAALQHGAAAMAEERLPLIDVTPNPYVCRTCGFIVLVKPAAACPVCNAHPSTFQVFLPVYWLEVFDPFQALKHLGLVPVVVSGYLDGLSDEAVTRQPPDGGWSIYKILLHLRDAQYLLNFRLGLMLEQEKPMLESQAVFEWADQEDVSPPNQTAVFESYRQSRQQTLARLEGLPLKDWWRMGLHQEFGTVTILQQASYFAAHELTHLPQLAKIRTD